METMIRASDVAAVLREQGDPTKTVAARMARRGENLADSYERELLRIVNGEVEAVRESIVDEIVTWGLFDPSLWQSAPLASYYQCALKSEAPYVFAQEREEVRDLELDLLSEVEDWERELEAVAA